MDSDKYFYTVEFQQDIISYIVKDKFGLKALEYCNDGYFDLIEHALIIKGVLSYHKKHQIIPSKSLLKEELLSLFNSPEYSKVIPISDRENVFSLIDTIYKAPIIGGNDVFDRIKKYKVYRDVKEKVESFNITDLDSFEQFSDGISTSVRTLNDKPEANRGQFLISDIKDRQLKRQQLNPITPYPFKQMNDLTNAGGAVDGSINVILDKPKNLKTTFLANLAIGYLKMKMNVFIADYENGEDELLLRIEQSLTNKTKKEILSGEFDSKTQYILRKYKRLGAELFTKRYMAYHGLSELRKDLIDLYDTTGFRPQVLLMDYAALTVKSSDNLTREISNTYVEIKNLALEFGIKHIWSPHHIKREFFKFEADRYPSQSIADAIDIVKHVNLIVGLNRTAVDKEEGVLRAEIIEQRDGVPFGRSLFHTSIETQRITEFKKSEILAYNDTYRQDNPSDSRGVTKERRKADID